MSHTPRRFERKDLQLSARLLHDEAGSSCHIVNISAGGAKLELESGPLPAGGAQVSLEIERFGRYPATAIWYRERQLGIRFTADPESMAEVVMGLAMYGESKPT